jgi:hypothetical protein
MQGKEKSGSLIQKENFDVVGFAVSLTTDDQAALIQS